MVASLMKSYGYEPNFAIHGVPGAYQTFLEAAIAFDEGDRKAVNAAFHASLKIEETYIAANMSYKKTAMGNTMPVYPERPNLGDWIMERIVELLKKEKAA